MTTRKSNAIELVRQATSAVFKAESHAIIGHPRDADSAGYSRVVIRLGEDLKHEAVRFEISDFCPNTVAPLSPLFVRETQGLSAGYIAYAEQETGTIVVELPVPCGPLAEIERQRLAKCIADIAAKGRQTRQQLTPDPESLAKRYAATPPYIKRVIPYAVDSKTIRSFAREGAVALRSRAVVALVEEVAANRRLATEAIAAELLSMNETLARFDVPIVPTPKAAELLMAESPGTPLLEATQFATGAGGGPPPTVWAELLREVTDQNGILLVGSQSELRELLVAPSVAPDPLLPIVLTLPRPGRRDLIRYFATRSLGSAPTDQDVTEILAVLDDCDDDAFDHVARSFVRAWAANSERVGRWTRPRLRALANSLLARRRTLRELWPTESIDLKQEGDNQS